MSVLLKGIHGLVELFGGVLVWAISGKTIERFIAWITEGERIEDPHDLFVQFIVTSTEHLIAGRTFAILYLMIHGAINFMLAIGLWRNWKGAYQSALLILGIFTLYQIYRMTFTFSYWLLFLTVFDVVVLGLIYYEYTEHRRKAARLGK
jgi:uncharacterized membrane protein